MKNLPIHLKEKYERDRATLPPDDDLPPDVISYSDVLQGYYFLIDYFENLKTEEQMFAGLGNKNLLASAISRQFVAYCGYKKWNDPILISSSLFYGLVKNHAFFDGNKRIALLMLLKSLLRQKRVADAPQGEFEDLTVSVAGSNLEKDYPYQYKKFKKTEDPEIYFIADFIRKKTRALSSTYPSVTFRELNAILKKHGYELDDAHDNSIRVYQHRERKSLLGFGSIKHEKVFLGAVGFPSWTKQIAKSDLRKVRELTGLTTDNGYDNQVLFEDSEPVYRLIHDFEVPLKRLKDR